MERQRGICETCRQKALSDRQRLKAVLVEHRRMGLTQAVSGEFLHCLHGYLGGVSPSETAMDVGSLILATAAGRKNGRKVAEDWVRWLLSESLDLVDSAVREPSAPSQDCLFCNGEEDDVEEGDEDSALRGTHREQGPNAWTELVPKPGKWDANKEVA